MKLDVYKTMTTWAKACQNEATVEDSPFCLLIENPDGKSCTVALCADSHKTIMLAEHMVRTLVQVLKQSIVDEKKDERYKIINDTLQSIVAKALVEEFPKESLKNALNGLGKLMKGLSIDEDDLDEEGDE